MKYGLSKKQLDEIIAIIKSYPDVEAAILFGSRAINTFQEASDVDIVIKGEKANFTLAARIKGHLEDETYLPFFFDIVSYNSIDNDALKLHIEKYGKVLYEQDVGKTEWRICKLSDLASVQTGPFGSQLKNEQYIVGGIPVITVEHIKNFRILDITYPSVTALDKARLSRYHLQSGDIVFTRVGSVDLSAYVQAHQDGWLFSSRMLRVRPNTNKISPRFLSYFFQQKSFREYILNISVGATMPSINTKILNDVLISYPNMPEQKAIAEILSSLDDKIDLLHRQNKTLESLAETLFRQWFIEEASEEWEDVKLSEIADIKIGRTPPRKESHWFSRDEADIKWISIRDLAEQGVYLFNTQEFLTKAAVKKFRISIIPKDTVLLSFKMTVGRVAITSTEMLSNEAIAHFNIKDKKVICKEFIYLYLKQFKYETLGSTSSIVTSINSEMIKNMQVFLPSLENMRNFKEQAELIFDRIRCNQLKSNALEQLRDILLPKLMNGEVQVQH